MVLRDFFHYPDELMAQRSLEAGVAARYFQVSITKPRKDDAHQGLAASGGPRHVFNRNGLILTTESFHLFVSSYLSVVSGTAATDYGQLTTDRFSEFLRPFVGIVIG